MAESCSFRAWLLPSGWTLGMKIIAPDPDIPRRHIHGALGDASEASQRRLH